MALITTVANAYGARWFDEQWKPEFSGPEWKNALNFYVDTMKKSGPPGASSNGFNENLALFNSGKCAMWVDASVAGSFVTDKTQSKVADHVGFTYAPHQVTDKGSAWLYSWALAIPTSSKAKDAAKEFSAWATSKEYGALVAEDRRHRQRTARHPRFDLQRRLHERGAFRQGHPGIAEGG
jgi:sorbitol/mannitol transport system substrate-binding protein